jgi:predicted acylesterase/phospholipase RssA
MRVALIAMYAKQQTGYRKFASPTRPPNRFVAAPAPLAVPGRLDLGAIEYLALEGGGGKGAAYLGAIIAFEELGVLPVPFDGSGQIKGFSGASAGIITAFLLSLGLSSGEIWRITRASEFLQFLDLPANGRARCATFQDDAGPKALAEQNRGARIRPTNNEPTDLNRDRKHRGPGIGNIAVRLLKGKVARSKSQADDHILKALKRDPNGYVRNVFSDPGVFPGFAVRDFLARKLVDRMKQSSLYNDPSKPAPKDEDLLAQAKGMTFERFNELTNVDLVIAGTNLTTGKPAYFSQFTTPQFPVIEAVGISMSIPLIFKSVYLDTGDKSYDDFRGWWGDGGVINNFPLHAFNKDQDGKQPALPHERSALPLNLHTLGLTLEEPDLTQFGIPKVPEPYFPSALGMIMPTLDALMFSSTEGQIRNAVERQHTIRLNAYFLETYNMAPDPVLVAATVPAAKKSIYDAFGKKPGTKPNWSPTYKDIVGYIGRKDNLKTLEGMTSRKFVDKVIEDILD